MSARIQSGVVQAFSHYSDKHMWTGHGQRHIDGHVDFTEHFKRKPKVSLSLGGLDAGNAANLRVRLELTEVDEHHFEYRVVTWGDTKLAMVDVSWLAYEG